MVNPAVSGDFDIREAAAFDIDIFDSRDRAPWTPNWPELF
jgi:hypothetical protein